MLPLVFRQNLAGMAFSARASVGRYSSEKYSLSIHRNLQRSKNSRHRMGGGLFHVHFIRGWFVGLEINLHDLSLNDQRKEESDICTARALPSGSFLNEQA